MAAARSSPRRVTCELRWLIPNKRAGAMSNGIMPRNDIALDGVVNFRDLGGYRSDTGRVVRAGSLYRSGHLAQASEHDQVMIRDLDLGLICDLRAARERRVNPTPRPDRLASRHIELPIELGDFHEFSRAIRTPQPVTSTLALVRDLLIATNTALLLDETEVYARMFASILACDGDVLIHCTGGRDRTGVAVALILSALGVSEASILDDYVLSNAHLTGQQFAAWFNEHAGIRMTPEAAAPIAKVEACFLAMAFSAVRAKYTRLENYFVKALALDDKALTALRRKFLIDESVAAT